jgi:hypothetical protein
MIKLEGCREGAPLLSPFRYPNVPSCDDQKEKFCTWMPRFLKPRRRCNLGHQPLYVNKGFLHTGGVARPGHTYTEQISYKVKSILIALA